MPKEFNIIFVGSGIAGPTAAFGLVQKGRKVTDLKRHADTQELGGPITMSRSAVHILTQYDLKDKIFEQLKPQIKDGHFRIYWMGASLARFQEGGICWMSRMMTDKFLVFGADNVTAHCLKAVLVCIIRCDWGACILSITEWWTAGLRAKTKSVFQKDYENRKVG